MSILEKIEGKYSSLTKKEKQIALYILQHTAEVKISTIVDLAKKIGTSPALISRFCKKIDNCSFMELKLGISVLTNPEEVVESDIVDDHILDFYYRVIERTRRHLTTEAVNAILNRIKNAKRIYVYGVGSSGFSAMELQQRFIRMGMNCVCMTDSHMMLISSSLVTKGDLIIGLSVSGETTDTIKAIKLAKLNGATIIGLTSFPESTLAQLSDDFLIAYNSKFVNNERFVNSQFALMYLIDILSMKLLSGEQYQYAMLQTIETILSQNEQLLVNEKDLYGEFTI